MLASVKLGGRLLAATFLAAAFGSSAPAVAGSFQVNPVNIVVAPEARAATVTIKNTGNNPASIRVLTRGWTQERGQDVYSETSELLVSPPIFTVAAGATQIVRIGLRKVDPAREQAFRVIFEEIPRTEGTGIQVALRVDLPFYKLPAGGGVPKVEWSAWRDRNGELLLEARNLGTVHEQVLEIDSVDARGTRTTLSKSMGVVLPGKARQWKIDRRHEVGSAALLNLIVRSPRGETKPQISVEAR